MRTNESNLISDNHLYAIYMNGELPYPYPDKDLSNEPSSSDEVGDKKSTDKEGVSNWPRRRTFWYALMLGLTGAILVSHNIMVSYFATIILWMLTLDAIYHFFCEMFRKHWLGMMGALFYVAVFAATNYGNYKMLVKIIEESVYM